MSTLLTPDTFEFFARYLLAGYVVILVRSAYVAGLRPKPAELLIEAAHGWAVAQPWTTNLWPWLINPPASAKFVVRILIVPGLLGVALGLFLKSGWRNNLLRRFSLPVVHPVRRAHDFAFGNDRSAGLVEITFEDGAKIAGWFGEKSLAATDDPRSDLYLERAYVIDAQGNWMEPEPQRSVLVNLTNVRSIEFLSQGDMKHDETQNNAG